METGMAAQVIEWQNIIMAFCFTSALEIASLSVQAESGLSPSFYLLSFANLLTFLLLFVAKLIGHKQRLAVEAKVLEKVAIIVAATAFVLTTTIPFSLRLKWASWALRRLVARHWHLQFRRRTRQPQNGFVQQAPLSLSVDLDTYVH